MVNLDGSVFPSEGVRTRVRVESDQSLVGTWAAKRPAQSLVARLGWGGFVSIPHMILSIFIVSQQPKASRPEIAKMQVSPFVGKPARPRLPLPDSCGKSWGLDD